MSQPAQTEKHRASADLDRQSIADRHHPIQQYQFFGPLIIRPTQLNANFAP
jgi:hypothetical protein